MAIAMLGIIADAIPTFFVFLESLEMCTFNISGHVVQKHDMLCTFIFWNNDILFFGLEVFGWHWVLRDETFRLLAIWRSLPTTGRPWIALLKA